MSCNSALKAFNDRAARATLFVDFHVKLEDLDKVQLIHTRRQIKSKLSTAVYRPKTEDEMLVRWTDINYVELMKQEAITRGRTQKDRFAPNDPKKTRYWVYRGATTTLVLIIIVGLSGVRLAQTMLFYISPILRQFEIISICFPNMHCKTIRKRTAFLCLKI